MMEIQDGRLEHNDLAIYTLQLNARKQHKKMLIKAIEMREISKRLANKFPLMTTPAPITTIQGLPVCFGGLIKNFDSDVWMIEWMYQGDYLSHESDSFKKRFRFNLKGYKGFYRKVVNTLGFSKYQTAYKMWVETLTRPQQSIFYEGLAYQFDRRKVVMQKACMMSCVLDFEHVITVTTIV
jgi:hypothetical protein